MTAAHSGRRPARAAGALLLAAALACGGGGERAGAPEPPPPAPDLAGVRVMLFPSRAGSPAQLDPALADWLVQSGPATDWVLPEELQRAVDRVPTWRVRLDAIPRRLLDMGGGEVRVGDPLYGNLRRLGAVVDANYALLPLAVGQSDEGVWLMRAALVDIRGGRVLWRATVRGVPGGGVGSVAEALARAVVPARGG